MNANDKRKAIQTILGVPVDGVFGPVTAAAFSNLAGEQDVKREALSLPVKGKATSFADPADVAAFHRAKARGLTDNQAFKFGDNGIGYWDDDCTDTSVPAVAVPRDYWVARFGEGRGARGAVVLVTIRGQTRRCVLWDTMPALEHIENGARIDLAPGAQKLFGLTAPVDEEAVWDWENTTLGQEAPKVQIQSESEKDGVSP